MNLVELVVAEESGQLDELGAKLVPVSEARLRARTIWTWKTSTILGRRSGSSVVRFRLRTSSAPAPAGAWGWSDPAASTCTRVPLRSTTREPPARHRASTETETRHNRRRQDARLPPTLAPHERPPAAHRLPTASQIGAGSPGNCQNRGNRRQGTRPASGAPTARGGWP